MSEAQIGFLYKAASSLQQPENKNLALLRSYYLMRCKEITKGYGLPQKHFSPKARCSHCCLEWRKGTEVKIKPLKLSKKQRHKIRSLKDTKSKKEYVQKRQELLHSNEIEQICTFCKRSTVTPAVKPETIRRKCQSDNKVKHSKPETEVKRIRLSDSKIKENVEKLNQKNSKINEKAKKLDNKISKINTETNIYSVTQHAFSLQSKKNTIASQKKEPAKIIKNNKKKKDKFAGLCQKAVLASVKLKQATDKQNKLNLFLKPSS